MATNMLRSNQYSKTVYVLGLFSLLFFIQKGGAFQFKVGGAQGWSVPSDPNANSHNQWAENNRFQINDTLLFEYPANKDAVLQVTKDDYTNCNTAHPVENYTDGYTLFKFNQSGPYYFISGVKENCQKNEKLVVVVMADRSKTPTHTVASPPPMGPTEVPPSPAPSGEQPPSPPPSGTVETNPSAAPEAEIPPPHHHNGASSVSMSVIGFVGAFIGSSSLLLFV